MTESLLKEDVSSSIDQEYTWMHHFREIIIQQHLFSTYYISGSMLDIRGATMKKLGKVPALTVITF